MDYQATFKRYEVKYMLTPQQKTAVASAMKPYMELDKYRRTTIRNIYFDTENFRLIRHSLEGPVYKEKLRLRSYQTATDDSPAFIELKKKYRSVVYKRRIELPYSEAERCLIGGEPIPEESQIADEIEYFRSFYKGLRPAMFISYEREAFYSDDGSDFRVTFDENILYRTDDFSLKSEAYGTPILSPNATLMELKTSGAFPLWITKALTDAGIRKVSFSKYGVAYSREFIAAREQSGRNYNQNRIFAQDNRMKTTSGGRIYA